MKVDTANKMTLGRSGRLNYVHVTELALWESPKKPMGAVRKCVPFQADTIIFYESTSQGPGDYFHSRYRAAKERYLEDELGARAIFIDWKGFPYYSLPPIVGDKDTWSDKQREVLYGNWSEEEIEYIEEYDLTPGEATFYVHNLHEDCDGDQETFDHEMPISEERAFRTGGDRWFEGKAIRWMRRPQNDDDPMAIGGMNRAPKFRGDIQWLEAEDAPGEHLVEFIEHSSGNLKVWKWVEEKRQYIIAADFSWAKKRDWHVFHVWALPLTPDERPELVAKWKNCQVPATKVNQVLEMLGYYYNTALLSPERPGPGDAVAEVLKETRYPNIYRDYGPLGQVRRKVSSTLGYRVNPGHKRPALDQAKRMIDGLMFIIHDPETLDELEGFFWNFDKRDWDQAYENAVTGLDNDDEVAAIANFSIVYYRYGHRKWFTGLKTAEV